MKNNDNEQYMVSIVCDVYNHEQYLRQCLDGLIMQIVNFSYEILIHDDCSTDHSVEIIKEYVEKYPHLFKPIYQKENQYSKGISIWQTIQFPRAKGKYVAICEGDDFWTDPHKLQKQVDFLESHPDFSMCCHGADIQNETLRDVDCTCDKMTTREYFPDDAFPEWQIPTASIVYRREMVEKYKIVRSQDFFAMDVVLILSCMAVGRVWGFAEHMSVYRVNAGGLTRRKEDFQQQLFHCKHYEALMINFPKINKDFCDRFIAMTYYTKFRADKQLKQKVQSLWKAVLHRPDYVLRKMFKIKPKPRNDLFYKYYKT